MVQGVSVDFWVDTHTRTLSAEEESNNDIHCVSLGACEINVCLINSVHSP